MRSESLEPYEWDQSDLEMEADAANLEAFASWDENKNFADLLKNGAAAIRCVHRMRKFLSANIRFFGDRTAGCPFLEFKAVLEGTAEWSDYLPSE